MLIYGSEAPSLSADGISLHWKMKHLIFHALSLFGGGFFHASLAAKFNAPFAYL